MTYEEEIELLEKEHKRRTMEIFGGQYFIRDGHTKEFDELSYWYYVERFKIMKKYGKVQGEMPPYRGKRASDYE